MNTLYQVWAIPALAKTAAFPVASATVRVVTLATPSGKQIDATLLELVRDQEDPTQPQDEGMRELGKALSLLSFVSLTPFVAFAARVLADGVAEGSELSETCFVGTPPGLTLFEARLGFKRSASFESDVLHRDIRREVEVAITWFLAGINAPSAAQTVMSYWIALEALAPLAVGPWQCAECEQDVPECPHCRATTVGPKTVRSIRQYLRQTLGVEKKEYKVLYAVRCAIAHGEVALNLDSLKKVSDSVVRIEQLLLLAIKQELGWTVTDSPTIEPEGMTIVGAPAVTLTGKGGGPEYYDSPIIWPPNM